MKISVCIIWLFMLAGNAYAQENLFEPLPIATGDLTPKASLGKSLFHDPVLSKDGSVSCATCHPLLNYGVDNLPKSFGVDNVRGKRNTPTVWNARYNFSQFWDGRAHNLVEQVLVPIVSPLEMNASLDSVIERLKQNKSYNKQFNNIFDDGVTAENLASVIAEYEKTLISPGSRFDQYLRGDEKALSDDEKEGLKLFKQKGCIACHNGINIGGTLFQKIGMFGEFETSEEVDYGRYEITKKAFDKFRFKVPSLRNVEKTAPYFHDGSVPTLHRAVEIMVKLQLGRELDNNDIDKIVSFLKTLTGKVHD